MGSAPGRSEGRGKRWGARAAGMVCAVVRPSYQEREAMTSRQPGAMPPGIAGHAEAPGESGEPGHAEAPGEGSEKPDGGERAGAGLTAQDWLVGVLPVALLIVVGLAGLRGAVGTLQWDGPLHRDAVVVGVVLEA